jgi:hypothetical protein
MFFVAGDLKTPLETQQFCGEMDNCIYLSPELQKMHNYKSSELIGWNTDSRRNIALLEAMRWGADLIVSVDDDMIPIEERFWFDVHYPFSNPFNGLRLGAAKTWFNPGCATIPKTRTRGIPIDTTYDSAPSFAHNVQVGAAQGVILGVPDADAMTTITFAPAEIAVVSDVLHSGFVAHLDCKTVFNSQITTFRAELAPAFAQFYFAQKRNTDIMASMLMRRIMREKQWYTYYGPPMCFHARQPRPLFNDLKAEMYGLEKINEYADYLNRAPLPKDISVTESCRILAQGWNGPELEAAMAWYEDCEQVMK